MNAPARPQWIGEVRIDCVSIAPTDDLAVRSYRIGVIMSRYGKRYSYTERVVLGHERTVETPPTVDRAVTALWCGYAVEVSG